MKLLVVMGVLCIYQCTGLDILEGGADQLNRTLVEIMQENVALKQSLAVLQQRMSTIETNVNNQRAIAFSVALSRDTQLGQYQPIIYDTVYSNVGNGYDSSNGHFTAPVRGIYQFSTTVSTPPNKSVHVQIVKNGSVIGIIYAEADVWESGSTSTAVELNAGDVVSVRHYNAFGTQTIHGDNWTAFSGVLIHAI